MRPTAAPLLALVFCLSVAACSGSREAAPPPPSSQPAPARPKPAAPTARTMQGFRIQILTTPEKAAADREVTRAEAWWKALPARERPPYLGDRALSVDVAWKEPYYRVRLGAFASRDEARQALTTVRRQFPEAFLVPDLVTVVR